MTRPLDPEVKARRRMARLISPKRSPYRGKRKCQTRDCGACAACRMRARWQNGQGPHGVKETTWPREKIERLRALAGTMDRRAIARVLDQEFPYTDTTAQSVAVFASRNGISLWPPGHSVWELSQILGRDARTVRGWIDAGLLPAFAYCAGAGAHRSTVRVSTAAAEAFIRTHRELYRRAHVKGQSRLAQLARLYARFA